MKISTKIIIPFLIFLIILISTFINLLLYLNTTQERIDKDIQITRNVNDLSNRIRRLRQQTELSLLSYRMSQEDKYLEIIERNQKTVNDLLEKIRPDVTTTTGKDLLQGFENSRTNVQSARRSFIAAIQQGDEQEIRRTFHVWEIESDNSSASLLDFTNYNFQSVERSALLYRDLVTRIYGIAILLIIVTIICIFSLFMYMRRIITKPIQKLSYAARRIAKGDFSTTPGVYSKDELGDLAQNLTHMAEGLKKYDRNVKRQVERKEEELRRTKEFEAQKDNFMGIASHELKTPVTSLKVFTHLMQKESEKNGHTQYERYLQKTDEQINKLTSLVEGLLDITKMQLGKMPYAMDWFDLNDIVRDTIEVAQETNKKHAIILKGKARKKLYGDKDRISQVLQNFVSNALKYSPDSKKVDVTVTNPDSMVTVAVCDYGIGIDKKHQDKIFDRFFRVADEKESTFPGLGIGLYISSEIIKRHGGNIWVESEKEKGSTFYFSLPYKKTVRR